MLRFDHAKSNNFSANISGFVYQGHSNAKVQSQDDVNWNRYGVSARATYKMVDVYAAVAVDKINNPPTSMAGLFDSTATGLTIGADTYVTNETLMSLRYDNLDAGGILDQRKSATFVVVPAGRHQVTVWHETLGTLQREVTVPTQGDVSITIEFP